MILTIGVPTQTHRLRNCGGMVFTLKTTSPTAVMTVLSTPSNDSWQLWESHPNMLSAEERVKVADMFECDVEALMDVIGISVEDIIDKYDYDIKEAIEDGTIYIGDEDTYL